MGADETGIDCYQLANEMFRTIIYYCQQRVKLPKLSLIQFYTHHNNEDCYIALQRVIEMVAEREFSLDEAAEIASITQYPNSKDTNSPNLNSEILFIAECDTFLEPCKISVEYGSIQHIQGQVVIDVTKLCKQHSSNHLLSQNFQLLTSEHTKETIEFDSSCTSNLPLCHVCPYGLMAGFDFLLADISMRDKKSIICPLIHLDMGRADVHLLISKYELFLNQHKSRKSRINCIRFLIGNKIRAVEIATWTQQYIEQNISKLEWTITQPTPCRFDGITLWIAADNGATIQKIDSRIKEFVPSWKNQCIQLDDDDVSNMKDDKWHRFAIQFWCKYNTLVVRNQSRNNHGKLLLYGYDDDIIQTLSEIYRVSKSKWQQLAEEEIHEFTAKSLSWLVKSSHRSYPFCKELNYKIEKFYQTYQNTNSTSPIEDFGFYIKKIDFGNMMITTKENNRYAIDRVINQGKFVNRLICRIA